MLLKLEAFIEHEQDRGIRISTVWTRLAWIIAFLHFLMVQDVIPGSVLKRSIKLKLPDAVPRAMNPADVIHLNPVCVGTMKKQPVEVRRAWLRTYPWSSYRGYAGLRKSYECVDESPILGMLSPTPRKGRLVYRRFVEAGLAETDEELVQLLKESKWGMGGSEFLE